MPKAIIRYKKPETLKILKALAEYFDFEISEPKETGFEINGVLFIPGDKSADISELGKIFSGKNLDAAELRKKAWQRGK